MTPNPVVGLATWSFRPRVVLPFVALLFGLYLTVVHPWLITWGATGGVGIAAAR
jgi:hypothetical protein